MHGQCDSRPTVTFPAIWHHRPLTGTNLYCLVTEAHVCEQLAWGCYLKAERPGVKPRPLESWVQSHNHYTAKPHMKWIDSNNSRVICRVVAWNRKRAACANRRRGKSKSWERDCYNWNSGFVVTERSFSYSLEWTSAWHKTSTAGCHSPISHSMLSFHLFPSSHMPSSPFPSTPFSPYLVNSARS